ncbi:ribonuclease J [Candidatus Peregrinibacteria bacterium]|nr:ribonuclease J [Candidatus Peregrinibacteria bacterium]
MTNKLDRWIEEKLQDTASPKHIITPSKSVKNMPYRKKNHHNNRHNRNFRPQRQNEGVKIIPFGGLDEVGKNMMAIEYRGDIIIIDMGFQFPEEDMLGIDYVIPDISYLEKNIHKIRGVIITHGHLDHTGAIPYILPRLNFPKLYATKLTMGLIQKRIEEFGIQKDTIMRVVNPDDTLKLGAFTCSFFRVNHSIPDGVGVIVDTPHGTIVHSGDFKFDPTPADQKQADYDRIADLGHKKKATILFSDSTNALKPGRTMSEKTIGETLDKIIGLTPGRIIIASFSSLIGRIQQILASAEKWKRKVFVSGRSLVDNMAIAEKLGYLKIKPGLIHDIRHAEKSPPKDALILTTGSQGESVSALTRISLNDHKDIKIRKGDTVIISATPIVGNERAIFTVIDNLSKLGAKVIYNKIMDVHTSGHGYQEDLKMMLDFVRPGYFAPIHGQYHMRAAHADLALEVGVDPRNIFMINNGDILEMRQGRVTVAKEKVETNYILVDGLGMGDIGSRTIFERQILAENGVLVVGLKIHKKTKQLLGPIHIEAHGFVYLDESDEVLKELISHAKKHYEKLLQKHQKPGIRNIKDYMIKALDKETHKLIERRPLIVPVITEV